MSGIAEKSTISLSTNDAVSLPETSVKGEEILESSPKTENLEFLTRQLPPQKKTTLKYPGGPVIGPDGETIQGYIYDDSLTPVSID